MRANVAFLAKQTGAAMAKGADRGKASQTALNDLAHVMLNLNEFFYIK